MARRAGRTNADFAPELASRPGRGAGDLRRVKNATEYDAGSTGTRRTATWRAPTSSPNSGVLGNLATLRDRSRSATRNDGYAKGIIDSLVSEVVGTGIQPEPMGPVDLLVPHPVTKEPVPWRAAVKALFLIWTDESDADGMLDFYGQQSQAVRCWYEGGEAFVRFRPRLESDGLSVPLQLQVLEPELCPYAHTMQRPNGNIRAGIEFNRLGKRTAYWFHPSRPDVDDFDASQLRRLPADSVVHLYDPLRAGQIRGVPLLTQILILLYELDKYGDATLLRQQLSNMYLLFIKRATGVGSTETVNPLTGETTETVNDRPVMAMEPGLSQMLDPDEDVVFSDPPAPNGFGEFMRENLYAAAAGSGVPYEVFTGDMRGVNDRTVRLILLKFRRRVQAWQHQIVVFQLCRRTWRAWMDRVFLSGALPIPFDYLEHPERWLAVDWKPQGHPYMNPVQDVQANTDAVRAGFKSRSEVVSEQGGSVELVDVEQAEDNKRADGLELKYDSDGRNAANGTPPPPLTAEDLPVPEPAKP